MRWIFGDMMKIISHLMSFVGRHIKFSITSPRWIRRWYKGLTSQRFFSKIELIFFDPIWWMGWKKFVKFTSLDQSEIRNERWLVDHFIIILSLYIILGKREMYDRSHLNGWSMVEIQRLEKIWIKEREIRWYNWYLIFDLIS